MHLVPIISTGTYRWLQLRMGLRFSKDNVKTCHLTRVNSAIGATSRIVRIRDAIRSPANFHSYLRITIRAAKSTMLMTALDLVKLFSRDWKDSGIDCTLSCSPSRGMSRPFVLKLNTNAGVEKQDVKLMRLVTVLSFALASHFSGSESHKSSDPMLVTGVSNDCNYIAWSGH